MPPVPSSPASSSVLLRLAATIAAGVIGITTVAYALRPAAGEITSGTNVEFEDLSLAPLPERSLMYDRNGGLMAVLHAEQNRSAVRLADVPQHVVDAILAVEDWDFYQHQGVDLRSTVRALFENVESGGISQGGSTITMQVVKLSLLTSEQSLERKVREAILAMRLEDQMTKDEILERYLNIVYFGNGAYGVQAAAETYFQTSVQNLTWGQAALLAGVIRDPNDYDPLKYPDVAAERRRIALNRLVEVRRITQADVDAALLEPLPASTGTSYLPPPLDYFPEDVKQQLLDNPAFGLGATPAERYNTLFYGGIRISTTFDPAAQQAALQARADVLPGEDPNSFTYPYNSQDFEGSAAVVSVEPTTGAVRTLVGGPGYERYQHNIATTARRDNGSSFKVFVLVAALENGIVPNDSIDGSSPCSFRNAGSDPPVYRLVNFEGGTGGGGTITSQTLRSSNCAYVRLGQVVGIDNVIAQAQRMGVTVDLPSVMSLPLGVGGVPAIQMAGAMASIANDGIYNPPYYIEQIQDRNGNVLYQHDARRRAGHVAADGQAGHGRARPERPERHRHPGRGPQPAGRRQDRHGPRLRRRLVRRRHAAAGDGRVGRRHRRRDPDAVGARHGKGDGRLAAGPHLGGVHDRGPGQRAHGRVVGTRTHPRRPLAARPDRDQGTEPPDDDDATGRGATRRGATCGGGSAAGSTRSAPGATTRELAASAVRGRRAH